jgi:hypothetical protein
MKRIEQLVSEIAKLQNKATSHAQAIEMGLSHYYAVDHNSVYGGYRIDNVNVESGSHSGTFGESSCVNRRSMKKMVSFLEGVLFGIEYSQKVK